MLDQDHPARCEQVLECRHVSEQREVKAGHQIVGRSEAVRQPPVQIVLDGADAACDPLAGGVSLERGESDRRDVDSVDTEPAPRQPDR